MIVSASRRTDLPALYGDWLLRRWREGFALTRNPYNPHALRRVSLRKEELDGLVLWTKNPRPLLEEQGVLLDELDEAGIPYYFQFTLTPYGRRIEPGLPPKKELAESLFRLSRRVGPERVVWRYDPVIVSDVYSVDWHRETFQRCAAAFSGAVDECVFSFLDLYPRNRSRARGIADAAVSEEDQNALAQSFAAAAASCGMRLRTCCEGTRLSRYGISPGACIDAARLERLSGRPVAAARDSGQRPGCRCAKSVDIGGYDTCTHGCVYCYATAGEGAVKKTRGNHHPDSPVLIGWPEPGDRIAGEGDDRQLSLFPDKP